jgi:hypothetical protein
LIELYETGLIPPKIKRRKMYSNNQSGHKGVSRVKSGRNGYRYIVQFRKKYIGIYGSISEVAAAYKEYAATVEVAQ